MKFSEQQLLHQFLEPHSYQFLRQKSYYLSQASLSPIIHPILASDLQILRVDFTCLTHHAKSNLCICVWYAHVCVDVCTRRGQKSVSGIFLSLLFVCFCVFEMGPYYVSLAVLDYVHKVGLKFKESCLLLPLGCWKMPISGSYIAVEIIGLMS